MHLRYFIILLATPFLLTAKELPVFTGKIAGERVRLRSSPHLNSAVIGELHKDDYVKVIGEQAGFLVIEPPSGMKMYVYRTYVFDQTVDANNVNVRLSPSLQAPIVAQLHSGDKVTGKPSSQNPKWLEIDPPSTAKLYIAKDYVVKVGGEDFLKEQIETLDKANNLLLTTYKDAESEMKKTAEEMQLEPLIARLNNLKDSWNTLPEHKKRASELKELLEETSKNGKVAALEAQAASASAALEAHEKQAHEQRLSYELRIQ
ncbi:MAG: SH3 domain-containing protein, partial [Chlamydiota bacterium]